jgi:hypothetical protein
MPQVSATSATPPPAAAASDTPIPPDTHLRDGGHSDTTLARARLAIGGALLTAYLFTRPWGTEGTLEGAAAWADPRWPLSHLAAMVGFTGLVAAAHGLSRDWSHHARRLVDSTAWASLALLLPYYGAEAFALHAIGRAATQTGDLDLVALAEPIRMGALQVTTFGLGWLALGILAATVGRGLTGPTRDSLGLGARPVRLPAGLLRAARDPDRPRAPRRHPEHHCRCPPARPYAARLSDVEPTDD